ncbi:energy-coupling factor ABC transporter substrate-binding protein [Peribacillus asahii]|uniref:energy-coupling factor ABC transporter substrate-binding protein n=1 Tax=Peribacillus asahii TaxID=228899 RepID=UPI00207A5242|nr:energy-coupling factor ABC transporter substrate-binding protein [Peribacillus asahii]USK59761.1 energy-coupling factor ABC transporter substrate-binding protein [Peribacillus asahii]
MKKNLLLLGLVVILAIFPLFIQKGAEFGGADGEAEEAIGEINSSYEPWFSSIWEPPSGEIESLLFVLQAAIGAGFIGYFVGYARGKSKSKKEESPSKHVVNR